MTNLGIILQVNNFIFHDYHPATYGGSRKSFNLFKYLCLHFVNIRPVLEKQHASCVGHQPQIYTADNV